MADAFDSDPDIYISKSKAQMYPNSGTTAQWYCEKKGSETCVLANGEFAVGETIYLGVRCVMGCSYKLRAWFTKTTDLTTSSRRQLRFDAYSTQILKYRIPKEVKGAATTSIELKVDPELSYTSLDLYLSLDSKIYMIEEQPAAHLSANGVVLKFGDKDYKWCKDCDVYAILNVYKEDRYYISSIARASND